MRDFESRRGGNPRASHGQPCRSFSPAKRHRRGIGVQPGWQILGGWGRLDCGVVSEAESDDR